MNLQEFYALHGTDGLRDLSKKTGARLRYLRNLTYAKPINGKPLTPCLILAKAIEQATKGKITVDELQNPSPWNANDQ